MEIAQRRGAHLDDVSYDEGVTPNPNLEPKEYQDEKRLLRVLTRAHSKPIVEVVPYNGKSDANVVLDWISDMEKLFEFESTLDNKKVKITVVCLKCEHTSMTHYIQNCSRMRS